MKRLPCLAVMVLLLASAYAMPEPTFEEWVEQVQREIDARGLDWEAGETEIARMYYGKEMPLSSGEYGEQPATKYEQIEVLPDLPASFDWRDYRGGDWTTSIKSQNGCGSCWLLSAVGAVEAQFNIFANNPNLDLDLSEQEILTYNNWPDYLNCNGGGTAGALDYIRNYGVVDEACVPYEADDETQFPLCDNADERRQWIADYIKIGKNGPMTTEEFLKSSLILKGPVLLEMKVSDEFIVYSGGVYEGDPEEPPEGIDHDVLLVGYNDDGRYWVIKNSWGTDWGEDGFGRIRYGESIIEGLNGGGTTGVEVSSLNLKDSDNDRFIDVVTGGDDCDDYNPNVHPGKEYGIFYKDSLVDAKWELMKMTRASSETTMFLDSTTQGLRFYTVMEASPMMRDDDGNGIPDSWKPVEGLTPLHENGYVGVHWESVGPATDYLGDDKDSDCDGSDGEVALTADSEQELRELQKAIKERGLDWEADMTDIVKLYHDEEIPLSSGEYEERPTRIEIIEVLDNLPESFDWSDLEGEDWTSPVKNQKSCPTCWAFADIATIEAKFNIFANNPELDLDLSEQDFLMFEFWNPVDENCRPYNCVGSSVVETPLCEDADERRQSIEDGIGLKGSGKYLTPEEIKSALITYGSIRTNLDRDIRKDFKYYTGGIYEPVETYPLIDGHSVLLVGYNDEEEYWVIKNSWGTTWGENGFGRLRYDKCGIENLTDAGTAEVSSLNLKDSDGDGFIDVVTGGDDCDDENPNVHPGREYGIFYKDSLTEAKWGLMKMVRVQSDRAMFLDSTTQGLRFYTVMEASPMMRDDDGNGIPDSWKPVEGLTPLHENGYVGVHWESVGPATDYLGDDKDSDCDGSDGEVALTADADKELRELQKAIEERGLDWEADMTDIAKLYYDEEMPLSSDELEQRPTRTETIVVLENLPSLFDWSNLEGGDWTSPVKSQGGCGLCGYFARIGIIEAQFNIFTNNPDLDLDLSEQQHYLGEYWNIVDEGCMPYNCVGGSILETPLCDDADERRQRIEDYISLEGSGEFLTQEEIKSALITYGPVMVSIGKKEVRTDLKYYTGGIYEPIETYPLLGPHAVLLVGYNDEGEYWVIKNSWGTTWGEGGFGRLRYGKCEIEELTFSSGIEVSSLNLKDSDNDGFIDVVTGGDDCDDRNPNVHPGKEYGIFYKDSLVDAKWELLKMARASSETTMFLDSTTQGLRFYTVMEASPMMRDDDGNGIPDSWKPVEGLTPIHENGYLGVHWKGVPPATDYLGDDKDSDCDGSDGEVALTADSDKDGFYRIIGNGDDCDDGNPNVHPGRRYQVFYKDSLTEAQWKKLGEPVRADGDSVQIVDESARNARMRFYAVMAITNPLGADSNGDDIPDDWRQVDYKDVMTGLDENNDITLSWPVEPEDRPARDAPGDGVDQDCDGADGSPLTLDADSDGFLDSEDLCPEEPGECRGCPMIDCEGCSAYKCSDKGPVCEPEDSLCRKMKCPRSGARDPEKCGKSFVVNYPRYDQMSCAMVDGKTGKCSGECSWTCGPRETKTEPESRVSDTDNVNANANVNVNRNIVANVNRNSDYNANRNINSNYA
jgi:C1A family cysteine protease